MRRSSYIMVFLALPFIFACQPQQSLQNEYSVWINGSVILYDQSVYHQGTAIGQVTVTENKNNVTKLQLTIDPTHEEKIQKNVAFYVSTGRLNLGYLTDWAPLLEEKGYICGFSSKAAFNWFKFKTVLSDRLLKSQQRARHLALQFG